jgi:lipopolysaccharide biosynthesis glycosyltransferase
MVDGPNTKSVAIAIALDDNFVPPARAMIESIRRHGGELNGVGLFVLTTGLQSSSVAALEHSASQTGLSLAIRTISDLSELGAIPNWAISTCLRLYVGDVCDCERTLYLDSDMLVLSSLAPLLQMDLGGLTAAAVVNHPPINVIRVAIRRSQRGDVDPDEPYFNAGVLLVDVDRWKSRSVGQRSRAFLKRVPTTRLLDQDALNLVLVNDWCQLDKEWNAPAGSLDESPMFRGLAQMNRSLIDSMNEWKRAQNQPRILHFTGQPKPWEENYPWAELKEQYHSFMLPEFGVVWPSSQSKMIADDRGDQRIRHFQRN